MIISNVLNSTSSCDFKLQYVSLHFDGLSLTQTSVFQDKVWERNKKSKVVKLISSASVLCHCALSNDYSTLRSWRWGQKRKSECVLVKAISRNPVNPNTMVDFIGLRTHRDWNIKVI